MLYSPHMKLDKTSLSGIIWSENYDKLATWYEEVLGFPVKERLNFPNDTGVDFDFAPNFFYVGKHDKVHGKNKDPYRTMIGFTVPSVSEAYEELKNKNIEWIAKPFLSPTGTVWCMTLTDPEGNLIQFFGKK